MNILIKDGVKYSQTDFKGKELEFEKIVFTQYKHLFGENSILFTKKKIQTATNIGSIPDAFVIDFEKEKWFIVEIEISNHNVYSHIVPQLTKFSSALNNLQTIKQLVKLFESEIKADPFKNALLLSIGKTEVFKTVSEILDKKPELIIIIEQQHDELTSVFNSLPFKTIINVFRTFTRNDLGLGDYIFQIEPLIVQKPNAIIKPEVMKENPIPSQSKVVIGDDTVDYIKRYAPGLDDRNTLISKMLNHIKTHKTVTWGQLKKVCVSEFGCSNELSGSIGASLKTLEHFKKIIIVGRGDNKEISINE